MAFIEPQQESLARIKVVGVGGGGQNAVTSMVNRKKTSGGVEFITLNTDLQALNSSSAQIRIQLGPQKTHGLGSGSDPQVGFEAAQESSDDIRANLQGADMIFIAAGLGGGTGTGASPVVAGVAKELGALTVGVVTKPFHFEGKLRMAQAEQGIRALKEKVDALIVIPNEKLLQIVDDTVPLKDAFIIADEVIGHAVEGISDLISSTGLVNVDFADVKTIMKDAGSALMGMGYAEGENRAERAAKAAIESPLLDVDIKGSTGVLINIVGDASMTMHEVNTAANIVSSAAHEGANIIFGANIDPSVQGIKVTVIATGFGTDYITAGLPDMPAMSGDELLDRIESRIDTQRMNEVDEDGNVIEEEETTIVTEETDFTEYTPSELEDELMGTDAEDELERIRKMTRAYEAGERNREKKKEKEEIEEEKPKETEKPKSFWNFIGK